MYQKDSFYELTRKLVDFTNRIAGFANSRGIDLTLWNNFSGHLFYEAA